VFLDVERLPDNEEREEKKKSEVTHNELL